MILYIDATAYKQVTFAVRQGKLQKKTYRLDIHRQHKIIDCLEQFLKFYKIRNPQSLIDKIIINKGPGSFTGIRVSAALAQALSLSWQVPLRAVTGSKFAIK